MKQQTFSDIEYSNRKRTTKRETFLASLDEIISWKYWVDMIRPYYPSGKRGHPPKGIEVMLRMSLMQNRSNLSDEGREDEIYDSYAMRSFMHLDFLTEQVPDATTLLHFRHLIEKNQDGKRDPEMHQTKKGNEWYFGMKIHSGVDAGSGYVHTITGTAANVHDIVETSKLICEDDEVVYGDSGYQGATKRPEFQTDEHLAEIEQRANARPKSIKVPDSYQGINWDKHIENRKSSTRAKVEHPYLIVKRQFGYRKTVYQGIKKNLNRFHILFASANLVMCFRTGRTHDFCMVRG